MISKENHMGKHYFIAGKSLKGSDVVHVMETITFGNKVLPKRVKVDDGSEFISEMLDKRAHENEVAGFFKAGKTI